MKKRILVLTVACLLTLTGCAKKESHSSSTLDSSETKSSELQTENSTNNTSSSSSTTSDSSTTQSIDQEPQSTFSAESTVIESNQYEVSQSSADLNQSTLITTEEQAKQRIIDTQPIVSNPDIVLNFYKQIGSDFLFSLHVQSISRQGGSGSAGFYRVTPQGDVFDTDSYGNPF